MSHFQLCDPEFVANCCAHSECPAGCIVLEAHFSSIDHPLDPDRPGHDHLPGAIQMHPSYLEAGTKVENYYPFYQCPEDGNLLPHAELVTALERLGITPETPVIVYGTDPDGPMAAARIVWGLIFAGVKQVRLLDGGIRAWMEFGGPTVPAIEKAEEVGQNDVRVVTSPSPWVARTELVATLEEVRELSERPCTKSATLVDVRNLGEWDGSCPDYYTFFSDAGHIPNSHFQGNWEILLDKETETIGKNLAQVAQYWRHLGILDAGVEAGETELIFYCGTGWRSSLAFLVAELLGLRAKNFDDGFYGWTWSDGNEITFEDSPCQKAKSSPPLATSQLA